MKKTILLLMVLATTATAFTNSTMTEAYRMLVNLDPIHAILTAYEGALGSWFWMIMAMAPYVGMWLYQRNFMIANIWLISVLTAYRTLLDGMVPTHVFYLLVVVWLGGILYQALSPKFNF